MIIVSFKRTLTIYHVSVIVVSFKRTLTIYYVSVIVVSFKRTLTIYHDYVIVFLFSCVKVFAKMETRNLRLSIWNKKTNLYFLNTAISFFIFKIFKYKMNCIMQNKVEQQTMLVFYVKII